MSFTPPPEFETFIRNFIISQATTIFSAFPPPSDQTTTTDPQTLIFTVYSNLNQNNKSQPLPASKSAIEALQTVTVTEQEEECAICLTALCSTELCLTEKGAKEMPCKHRYHADCIIKWLGVSGSCPVCRYEMPVDEEEEEKRRRDGGERWQVMVTVASGGSVNDMDSVENMDVELDSGSMEDLD